MARLPAGMNSFFRWLKFAVQPHAGQAPHLLFDPLFYLARNPDVAAAGDDPYRHYLTIGWKQNRSPHPLFDVDHYFSSRGSADIEPLAHYLSHGWKEGRSPHRFFDIDWYFSQPQAPKKNVEPLTHYVESGWRHGLSPHPFFDAAWYLRTYTDVAASGMEPLAHFLEQGLSEKRSPHPLFDSSWYLQYPDVAASGFNPLVHYVEHGAQERRQPNPMFNALWYANRPGFPAGEDPLRHYIEVGGKRGLRPGRGFAPDWCRRQMSPVDLGCDDEPLAHFLHQGDGRQMLPAPLAVDASGRTRFENWKEFFDDEFYFEANPDMPRGINAWSHARDFGINEQRTIFPEEKLRSYFASLPDSAAPESLGGGTLDGSAFDVLVSAEGNFFMKEIAAALVTDLRAAGAKAELAFDTESAALKGIPIVVAPHEFFLLGEGLKHEEDLAHRDFFILNTEQPQTAWFQGTLKYLLACRGVLDFSAQSVAWLQAAGLPAEVYSPTTGGHAAAYKAFLAADAHPLLHGESLRIWQECKGGSKSDRNLDVSFLGGESPRRLKFFREAGESWGSLTSAVFLRPTRGPIVTSSQEEGFGHFLARHSKVVLNIHRDEMPFFEFHRVVMQAIAGGALVVSEPCFPHPLFKAGVHYLEAPAAEIPELTRWLVSTPEGRSRTSQINAAAAALLTDACRPGAGVQVLAKLLAHRAGAVGPLPVS